MKKWENLAHPQEKKAIKGDQSQDDPDIGN